ncbi:MAG TPA: NAD-dependent epimerase/dehydratase family protein, partial [Chitinophagaceae bacterium]|nr:NAD-dependent epimerase/dehydratase family protein [Chitinophagaceae bacterium]
YVDELYAAVFSQLYGFHTIGLRYFNVFGPRQLKNGAYAAVIPLFINAALENRRPTINGDGTNSRDFTFVANAVQANVRALLLPSLNEHSVVNIAVGEATSLNQLWTMISSIAGTTLQPVYREERVGDVKHSLADVSKARSMIGYQPTIDIQRGLELAVEWYRLTSKESIVQ